MFEPSCYAGLGLKAAASAKAASVHPITSSLTSAIVQLAVSG
jgi:hypothetical protein